MLFGAQRRNTCRIGARTIFCVYDFVSFEIYSKFILEVREIE